MALVLGKPPAVLSQPFSPLCEGFCQSLDLFEWEASSPGQNALLSFV